MVSGDMYLVSQAEALAAEMPPQRGELGLSGEPGFDALTAGQFRRLEGFRVLAHRSGALEQQPKIAIVNVTHNSEYYKLISTTAFPALMRSSHLCDLVTDSCIPVATHWLVQGFPHPGLLPSLSPELLEMFPCADLVFRGASARLLTPTEERVLMGNGMHLAQIGCWFTYNLIAPAHHLKL